MANEELSQRRYLTSGSLKGEPFGLFEELNIGATSVKELSAVGLRFSGASSISFSFQFYKAPKSPGAAKPDRVFLRRIGNNVEPVAVGEHKAPGKMPTEQARLKAAEQALFAALALGVKVAVTTNGERFAYIDVAASADAGEVRYFQETRDFNPAVLEDLLAGGSVVYKDPKPLAETVWQIIWHATKEEPKACLLTFVEIFVLKFLSDNLPLTSLPDAYRFYTLLEPQEDFKRRHGKTAIAYYVSTIRPYIKQIFPDNTLAEDPAIAGLFGLKTIVSKTSVINGFAFLKSSEQSLDSYNRTFLQILAAFQDFGSLSAIDPEFKLRLYETFLKNTPKQQKLGQFFTPRNVVRQMIRMAQLSKLKDGSVVLDPAAGVGGFVLEPLLIDNALPSNIKFENGKPSRRVKVIGVDVDVNTHILAKANMLIHLAELLREPSTTLPALNRAMAESFVLMNDHETLGSLANPPRNAVDTIITNPPYVTQGSKIYRDELAEIKGKRNGEDLRDYYDRWGLGVESLFIRYISGALKPGGRAFVIVPLGMLNRTEAAPKRKILEECNIVASITLPRNTFFNTSQPTSILVLEKRHSVADTRPPVFCAVVRTIGETLDVRRVPTPGANDLEAVADLFISRDENPEAELDSPLVKLIAANRFEPEDRWDVARFWSEEELVTLGFQDAAVERGEFIDEAINEIAEISKELEASKQELSLLSEGPTMTLSLSDPIHFRVRSGTRITNGDIEGNPGDLPVFSCFTDREAMKGRISRKWVEDRGIHIETKPIVTVMANGAKAVGKVFVRDEVCVIVDDVIAVEVISDELDLEYLASELRRSIDRGNYLYEAKLFVNRVRQLTVTVPIDDQGNIDLERQRTIANAVKRFDAIRAKLSEVGRRSIAARVV